MENGVHGHRFLNVLLPVLVESRPDPDNVTVQHPIPMVVLVMRMGQMKLLFATQKIVQVSFECFQKKS